MFLWVALIFMILFTIFHFWFDFRSFLKTGNSMVETFTGNNSEFIQLIGDNFKKPRKGATLDVSEFKSWDNFVFSLTIRPLGKKRGWTNIIHNTFTGRNCCRAGDRWPAIWFCSNSTRLHIRIGKAGGSSWNNGINTSYHLPLNKESRVVVDLNNNKLNVKIFDENDKLVFEQTKNVPTARPQWLIIVIFVIILLEHLIKVNTEKQVVTVRDGLVVLHQKHIVQIKVHLQNGLILNKRTFIQNAVIGKTINVLINLININFTFLILGLDHQA